MLTYLSIFGCFLAGSMLSAGAGLAFNRSFKLSHIEYASTPSAPRLIIRQANTGILSRGKSKLKNRMPVTMPTIGSGRRFRISMRPLGSRFRAPIFLDPSRLLTVMTSLPLTSTVRVLSPLESVRVSCHLFSPASLMAVMPSLSRKSCGMSDRLYFVPPATRSMAPTRSSKLSSPIADMALSPSTFKPAHCATGVASADLLMSALNVPVISFSYKVPSNSLVTFGVIER